MIKVNLKSKSGSRFFWVMLLPIFLGLWVSYTILMGEYTGSFRDEIYFLFLCVGCISIYNMTWSFRGWCGLASGKGKPVHIYQSTLFLFFCTGVVNAYDAVILGTATRTTPLLMLALLIYLMANTVALVGNRYAVATAKQFYRLYNCLPEALAMADLYDINPEAARELAEEARDKIAGALVRETELNV